MTASFSKKRLEVTITLGTGSSPPEPSATRPSTASVYAENLCTCENLTRASAP